MCWGWNPIRKVFEPRWGGAGAVGRPARGFIGRRFIGWGFIAAWFELRGIHVKFWSIESTQTVSPLAAAAVETPATCDARDSDDSEEGVTCDARDSDDSEERVSRGTFVDFSPHLGEVARAFLCASDRVVRGCLFGGRIYSILF